MGSRAGGRRTGPKCIAIVGPFASGKTTLLEALLARTGAIPKQHPVTSGNTISDHSAEAKAHAMSVEAVFATTQFMGESITFVDCPGSVEFAFEADPILAACDLAVVVAEPDEKKIPALQLVMRKLDDLGVPRFLFLNKIDTGSRRVRETLGILQRGRARRCCCARSRSGKNGIVVGFIDLALERAFIYREHAPARSCRSPPTRRAREGGALLHAGDARRLRRCADGGSARRHGAAARPHLRRSRRELQRRHVVPVLIGSAERGNGVTAPAQGAPARGARLGETRGASASSPTALPLAQVMKTWHSSHGGKLSLPACCAASS
jgi:elongation factor G